MDPHRSVVKPDDYIPADLFVENEHVVQYQLDARNSSLHKWYYYPKMTRDEVLLIKHFDSDVRVTGRTCFHTAFDDPNAAPDAPPRESIEVRAIAFFPDAQPCSLPLAAYYTAETNATVNVQGVVARAFGVVAPVPPTALDWA